MKDIIIFDIDGTLANLDHRRPMVENLDHDKQDWKSFLHDWNVIKDTPVENIVRLAKLFYDLEFKIYLCSGRTEVVEQTTRLWLKLNDIKYDKLFMRKRDDSRKDDLVKKDFLKEMDKDRIWFVVDDRQSVVDMWRSEGLTVLQCAPGNF